MSQTHAAVATYRYRFIMQNKRNHSHILMQMVVLPCLLYQVEFRLLSFVECWETKRKKQTKRNNWHSTWNDFFDTYHLLFNIKTTGYDIFIFLDFSTFMMSVCMKIPLNPFNKVSTTISKKIPLISNYFKIR